MKPYLTILSIEYIIQQSILTQLIGYINSNRLFMLIEVYIPFNDNKVLKRLKRCHLIIYSLSNNYFLLNFSNKICLYQKLLIYL